jgi:hypothetical protein
MGVNAHSFKQEGNGGMITYDGCFFRGHRSLHRVDYNSTLICHEESLTSETFTVKGIGLLGCFAGLAGRRSRPDSLVAPPPPVLFLQFVWYNSESSYWILESQFELESSNDPEMWQAWADAVFVEGSWGPLRVLVPVNTVRSDELVLVFTARLLNFRFEV